MVNINLFNIYCDYKLIYKVLFKENEQNRVTYINDNLSHDKNVYK